MIERSDTWDVHGVPFIVPRIDGMGAARYGVDLDGLPVELVELHGVEVHSLQHLLLETDAASRSILVGWSGGGIISMLEALGIYWSTSIPTELQLGFELMALSSVVGHSYLNICKCLECAGLSPFWRLRSKTSRSYLPSNLPTLAGVPDVVQGGSTIVGIVSKRIKVIRLEPDLPLLL